MNNKSTQWTLDGFVEHFAFVHKKMLDHKFVWVLGAGASYASGIPLGNELVDQWLNTMYLRENNDGTTPLEKWATAEGLGITGFKYGDRARFYPRLYERCYQNYPEEGYAFLESVMSNKDPSPGYSILANALAADPPRHNVVVTTNFDNLVADALSIYTDTFPFVCGHESLTTFVRVAMRRPLICKIHRDLLLGPQNDPRSLRRLHDAWGTALRALFQHYTPIFIGYGGNDDTLMDLLESLRADDIKGQLIWCYYEGASPSERIHNLVTDLNGILVPVPDFDLLMVLLGEKMDIKLLDQEISERARERTDRYRERIGRLDTIKYPSVRTALFATYDRSGGWWAWEKKVSMETDLDRVETLYLQGLEQYPKSWELHCQYGLFLWRCRDNPTKAREHLLQATNLESVSTFASVNLASLLWKRVKDLKGAESQLRIALKLFPNDPFAVTTYADFLTKERHDHREAKRYLQEALKSNPKNDHLLVTYANLLKEEDVNEADKVYRQAIDQDPQSTMKILYHAFFLSEVGKNEEAGLLFRRAVELEPWSAQANGALALFLWHIGNDSAGAEMYFKEAVQSNPNDPNQLGNYGGFLLAQGRRDDAAKQIEIAKKLTTLDRNQLRAELALYSAIIARLRNEDYKPFIRELGSLFSAGYDRSSWSFSEILLYVRQSLSAKDHNVFSKLAAGILDATKVPDVNALLRESSSSRRTKSTIAGVKSSPTSAPRSKGIQRRTSRPKTHQR